MSYDAAPVRPYRIAAPVALFLLCACQAPDEALRFPHDVHASLGVECADCHANQGARSSYYESCATCHEEGNEVTMEQPSQRSVARIAAAPRPRTPNFGLTFEHSRHEGLACADCHEPSGKSMKRPPMEFCLTACHGEKAAMPLDCRSCHSELTADGSPGNHSGNWTKAHGTTALTRKEECAMCHEEKTCFSCHRTAQPADHNQHWRLRGHGVISSMNRERCMTCHRQDECSSCHESTQPTSHTLSWKTPVSRHCGSCHLPLSSNNCAACHDAATHNSAPAWPVNVTHVAGASCRTCHIGPGQKLEHQDNGDDCESCHAK